MTQETQDVHQEGQVDSESEEEEDSLPTLTAAEGKFMSLSTQLTCVLADLSSLSHCLSTGEG